MFNPILHPEKSRAILGIDGQMFAVTMRQNEKPGCLCSQKWISESRPFTDYHPKGYLVVKIRFDDDCGNGHNMFAITAHATHPRAMDWDACGCLHDDIVKVFPELAPLIKWHLCATDGPMHYLENTIYHASNRNLDAARHCAIWPDATEEELTAPGLRERLEARLPGLLVEFRAAMESAGFIWER